MGRPREFNEDQVLQRAMILFWEKGYEGASLADLLATMRLTRSSFYKAFESKECLFRIISARYDRQHLQFEREALAEATPRQIVERLLYGAADLQTGDKTPTGCLLVNGALSCSSESDAVRLDLAECRDELRQALRDRFNKTKSKGPLPAGVTSDEAARYVVSVINGMAVLAKGGATRKELYGVAKTVLLSWPYERPARSRRVARRR
jgi:AcrR family transcriptional regulator